MVGAGVSNENVTALSSAPPTTPLVAAGIVAVYVVALARSKILPRLRNVSLAHGMMTDGGAVALADNKAAFAHLDTLDLTGNYIRNVAPVRGICKTVMTEQREWDDEYRYVALAE